MTVDLGLLVLRVAIGGVVLAHGLIKIGRPIEMGARGIAAVRGVAGFFGSMGFWQLRGVIPALTCRMLERFIIPLR